MPTPQRPVLTGLDGSPESMMAAEAAAAEANHRRVPLRVVVPAVSPPEPGPSTWRPVADPEELLRRAATRIRTDHPGLELSTEKYHGDLADFLVEESRQASLVVVGPGHTGGYDRLFERFLTHRVVTHAHCPVLVARPGITDLGRQPIVVGVDGSEHSAAAVRLAFEEASLRQVSLRAVNVHCIAFDTTVEPRHHDAYNAFTAQSDAERLIRDTTARLARRYPDVKIEAEPTYAPDVTSALLRAATTADLIVVGSRGHTAITSLLLGSTSRALVERSSCAVLVTHTHL
jgi:nucleotide-binding universal stress UspA family protein